MRLPASLALLALIGCGSAGQALPEAPAGKAVERPLTNVTRESLAAAVGDARRYLAAHRGASVTIRLPAGTFDLSTGQTAAIPAVDVSDIDACPGTLTIAGAGMDRTTLIKHDDFYGVVGQHTRCFTIADLALKQRRMETTQGRIVSVGRDDIVLDVPQGFPTPVQLATPPGARNYQGHFRRWLKPYTVTPAGPQVIPGVGHIRWLDATRVPGKATYWRFDVDARRPLAVRPGQYLSATAKVGDDPYRFVDGSDITFRRIRFVNDARGKFRKTDRVTIQGCVVTPSAPINGVPVMVATSAGGPQIGSPDTRTTGHLVANNDFRALGDDPVNVTNATGTIRDNRITDAGRGIILIGSPDVVMQNNVLTRAPVVKKDLNFKVEQLRRRAARGAGGDEE